MISPANIVGLPAKVIQLIALFSNSESIFVRLLCWLPAKAFDVHRSKVN